MRYPTTVRPVHMHCPTTTATDGGSADIAGANICPSIRPTWQGLFLQSYCISPIHGGQMWEVWKMQGAIFNHGHMLTPLTYVHVGNAKDANKHKLKPLLLFCRMGTTPK